MIIQGRVVEQSKSGLIPVTGASVRVSGIWRTLSSVVNRSAAPPHVLNVHPPLYGDREKEVPCQSGDVNPVKGDRKALLSPAVRGTARLRLSNVTHLKPKGLIRIDGIRPGRSEVLAISSIDKHSASDQPTWVTLDWPLAFDHQAEASIERLDPQWERPQHTLVLDGHQGESCMLLDSIEGFGADVYIKIGDGL